MAPDIENHYHIDIILFLNEQCPSCISKENRGPSILMRPLHMPFLTYLLVMTSVSDPLFFFYGSGSGSNPKSKADPDPGRILTKIQSFEIS